jgi:DNA-binding MarR family transcriptional regulator
MAAVELGGEGCPVDAGLATRYYPAVSANGETTTVADDVARATTTSRGADVAVSILRTAALIERGYNKLVTGHGITIQQYNVLRILRGAGDEGLPTLVIRDRMIHEAPGVTRLLDKLEQAGYARRDRSGTDRRQVFCYITDDGRAILDQLDSAVDAADDVAVSMLTVDQQRELIAFLDAVRSARSRQA